MYLLLHQATHPDRINRSKLLILSACTQTQDCGRKQTAHISACTTTRGINHGNRRCLCGNRDRHSPDWLHHQNGRIALSKAQTKAQTASKPVCAIVMPRSPSTQEAKNQGNIMPDDARQRASQTLRSMLIYLAEHGLTYRSIAERTNPAHGWNANSIKQLAHRHSATRPTEKTSDLVRVVRDALTSSEFYRADESTVGSIKNLDYFESGHIDNSEIESSKVSKIIGNRFQKIRKRSASFTFPPSQAFIRFDWEKKRLITVMVNSIHGENGYLFSMKITGRIGNRRVIIGDILYTVKNTYYSGLGYEVNSDIDDNDFLEFNAFDIDEISYLCAPNEIGLECFTVQNDFLYRKELSVSFHGLDGRGNPISGIGALIRPSLFKKYGISKNSFSSVECSNHRPELNQLMKSFGATTLHTENTQ